MKIHAFLPDFIRCAGTLFPRLPARMSTLVFRIDGQEKKDEAPIYASCTATLIRTKKGPRYCLEYAATAVAPAGTILAHNRASTGTLKTPLTGPGQLLVTLGEAVEALRGTEKDFMNGRPDPCHIASAEYQNYPIHFSLWSAPAEAPPEPPVRGRAGNVVFAAFRR